jgi:hypothetical protein
VVQCNWGPPMQLYHHGGMVLVFSLAESGTTTYYSLLTTHYLLLTTHYLLLTTQYSLLTTHYSLLTTHYSLLTTYYSLLTTHYCFSVFNIFTTIVELIQILQQDMEQGTSITSCTNSNTHDYIMVLTNMYW